MTTYTIQAQDTTGKPYVTPFIALVKVDDETVETYDPKPSAPWMQTRGDLVRAVNAQYKGASYVSPEVFNAVHADEIAKSARYEAAREAMASIQRLERGGMPMEDIVHALFKPETQADGIAPTLEGIDIDPYEQVREGE